jgi:hypothetical protein
MMAGTPTTHYQLPTYGDSDAPDLTGAYNQAMVKIDTQMNTNKIAIDGLTGRVNSLESGSFAPSNDDATLTVQQLSEAKVTKAGIVYFKPAP